MSAAEMFDDALDWQEPDDDEGGYGLLIEDGWDRLDIQHRSFLDDEGRYLGPRDEQ